MSKDKIIGDINCGFVLLGFAIALLGFITMICHIIGIHTVLGISTIEGPFGIKVETINSFFITFIGLTMAFAGERMSGKVGEAGKAYRQEKSTPATSNREEGGYSISEKEVVLDLSKRKSIDNLIGHLSSQLSSTERTTKISFSNPDSLPDEINIRHATSGHSISRISVPKNSELKMRRDKFRDLITRRGKMKSYYLTVRKEDLDGYELEYKLKYNNSFVGDVFEWLGEDVSVDIDVLTMSVYFPSNKKVKQCEAFVIEPGHKKIESISNPQIEIRDDNLFLKFTLHGAKKGHKYLLKWSW